LNVERSAPRGAVFLSYASQDAEAARRICEALRAAGVEVWFDQSELRGGDAWDEQIRRQIRECALFVPVISANTQARHEGYFRLEWKLAEDRSHFMAKGRRFILPVSVDSTTERSALVPDAFLAAQWTRLPGGTVPAHFVFHVQALLAMPTTAEKTAPAPGTAAAPRVSAPRPRLRAGAIAGLAALLAVGAYFALRSAAHSPATATLPGAGATALAAEAAAPAATDKSIAVLPFANMSEDKDGNAFFSDGIQEDILTQLAHIRALRVVSRTSVMEYRGTTKRIPQIARELHVAYVLEGSVRRAGNRVRVTGQLIRAGTDEHVWAQSYDRDLTDIFAIQSELAQAIAGELDAALSPREQKLLTERPTGSVAAYDLFLKARESRNGVPYGLGAGRQWFHEREAQLRSALELDPQFALAWAELAVADVEMIAASVDTTPARLANAQAAIDRAHALAPDAPGVIRALGAYYVFGRQDLAKGRGQFEKLVELQPNDAESRSWLGTVQLLEGHWTEAIATQRQVTALDPRNIVYSENLQLTYLLVRRFGDEMAEIRRAMTWRGKSLTYESWLADAAFLATGSSRELDELAHRIEQDDPRSDWLVVYRKNRALRQRDYAGFLRLDREHPGTNDFGGIADFDQTKVVFVLLHQGDAAGARARLGDGLEKVRAELVPEPDNTQLLRHAALMEACLGYRTDALRHIERAVELVPEAKNARTGINIAASRASVYAWVGDKDRALAELARLLQKPGQLNVHRMKSDPIFAPLFGDPRFEALLNDPKNNAPLF
jgi:TolB-like protein